MKKNCRKTQEKPNKARLTVKSMSFYGRAAEEVVAKLPRPRTVPNLISGSSVASSTAMARPKLTKLLLNVTVQRSLGPVQVLISPELTVTDLIAATLRQYSKEGRRPIFPSLDPSRCGLHYSQFSLESLDPNEKLVDLGSRNFFLCSKPKATSAVSGGGDGEVGFGYDAKTTSTPPSSLCAKEAENAAVVSWLGRFQFMDFLL